ncbi:uncharacterized protein BDZ83DRAFT_349829 [Colletotrichum acutatum]|uniref:Uncharacterized protein n=1 Tax=Glomerella acutata TaxID=27357 RepID=A0AAD8UNC6_GLOAC|nr:uncharacterized protein BDZ83DRAFT_349829 [Colletotrichum acutatum]KAK1724466.1 hypothetical protein BDZ83DRAFT_349829 [Colletotrichum acutatum]
MQPARQRPSSRERERGSQRKEKWSMLAALQHQQNPPVRPLSVVVFGGKCSAGNWAGHRSLAKLDRRRAVGTGYLGSILRRNAVKPPWLLPFPGGVHNLVLLCCCLFVVNWGDTIDCFLGSPWQQWENPTSSGKPPKALYSRACLGLASDTGSVVASFEALGSSCDDTRSVFDLAITLCPSSLEYDCIGIRRTVWTTAYSAIDQLSKCWLTGWLI